MYKIYSDNKLLFHPYIDKLKVQNASVNLKQNDIGDFKFTIRADHPNINDIMNRKSIITVTCDDRLLFRGIPLTNEISFQNARTIHCKEYPYFLTYSIQRPYNFQGSPEDFLKMLIDNHNSQVDEVHRFTVGTVTAHDNNDYIVRADSTYMNTWDSIQKKCVDLVGGYLRFRFKDGIQYIDWLDDFDVRSLQEIEFGKNLIDLSQTEDSLDVCTRIIPQGAILEGNEGETGIQKRVDITSVNDGKDYVQYDSDVEYLGIIEKVVIWDDVTDPSILLSKAQEEIYNHIGQSYSISLNAVDLAHIEKDISNFNMCEYIRVISERNWVDGYYLPMQMSINLFNVSQNKITLGKSWKTLNALIVDEKNNVVETLTGQISTAKNEISQALTEYTNTAISSSQEETREILKNYFQEDSFTSYREEFSTKLSQTAESFEMQFNQINELIDKNSTDVNAQFSEIHKYIRFVDGTIVLGEAGNQITLKIEHDKISFYQSGSQVAYFQYNKLYITDAQILSSLQIGNFAFLPRSNGSLDFRKVR